MFIDAHHLSSYIDRKQKLQVGLRCLIKVVVCQETTLHEEQHPHESFCFLHPASTVRPNQGRPVGCHQKNIALVNDGQQRGQDHKKTPDQLLQEEDHTLCPVFAWEWYMCICFWSFKELWFVFYINRRIKNKDCTKM